jgi:4-amino-4-deoxy-L-arabinose transferase-like glycosyltransferase
MVTVARHAPPKAGPISRDWLAAAVLALVVLATRGIWFGDPVAEFDEQLYSLVGWRMTEGDLPYVDLWDRKPFGLFAIFAAAHWLFGPEPIAYQAVATLFAFAGAILVYALSRELVDRATATVAGALYAMLMALYGSQSGQSEIFFMPLMLAMLWLVHDWRRPDAARRALWAMALGGLALQIKYTVLPQCLFLGTFALYARWRSGATPAGLLKLSALFALLGLLPTIAVALLYAAIGQFDAFWFANFVSFFDRAPSEAGRLHPKLLVGAIPLAIPALAGLYAAFRLNPPRDWRTYSLYAGWALSVAASIVLPATTYLYYLAAFAPAAVLLALPLLDRTSRARWIPALMLAGGALWLLDLPDRYVHSLSERRTEQRLSDALAAHVGAERDCLYVFDGPAALYRTTGSCLPTKYIYPDHLNNALERGSLGVSQPAEIRRILAAHPGAIVTANKPVTEQCGPCLELVRQAVAADYRPLVSSALHGRMITGWVRKDLRP